MRDTLAGHGLDGFELLVCRIHGFLREAKAVLLKPQHALECLGSFGFVEQFSQSDKSFGFASELRRACLAGLALQIISLDGQRSEQPPA